MPFKNLHQESAVGGAGPVFSSEKTKGRRNWRRIMTEEPKTKRKSPSRRRINGVAATTGVTTPRRESLTRTVSLLSAALRAWETRHGFHCKSVWQRRPPAGAR